QERGGRCPCALARVSEKPGVVAEELLAGLALGITGALRQHAHALPDLERAGVRGPRDRERAGVGPQHGRQHADDGRLPGPVRAEEAEDDPGRDGEIQRLDGPDLAVGLAEAVRLERGVAQGFCTATRVLRSVGPLAVFSSTVPIPWT